MQMSVWYLYVWLQSVFAQLALILVQYFYTHYGIIFRLIFRNEVVLIHIMMSALNQHQ